MKNIVVIGACSAIAQATCRRLAGPDVRFFLVARNGARLEHVARDLLTRGAGIAIPRILDLDRTEQHGQLFDDIDARLGPIDVLLVAYGSLPVQSGVEGDFEAIRRSLHTNALSVMSVLELAARTMCRRGSGTIACIGSVAGDRGRKSNYVYGTAKAALAVFLQGLRNRLWSHGVHVLTIKPGFVDTPMTAEFAKGMLWATPDTVAADIVRAIDRRRDVIYTPWFWRWIMLVVRAIPERAFKRLSL